MRKILPYFLILIILVGLFSPMVQVNANATPTSAAPTSATPTPIASVATVSGPNGTATVVTTGTQTDANSCLYWFGINPLVCAQNIVLSFIYIWFFGVADLMLWLSGQFFNVMISISIGNSAQGLSGFVSGAWTVVRDLSNIFFILILLYVAIQTILGIGHETKKIIARVIIMALLINFSLFFTKVVIDSSNILALVFYNKLEVNQARPDDQVTSNTEKDIGGEIYKKFSGIAHLTDGTLTLDKPINNSSNAAAPSTSWLQKLGMLVIYGVITCWASYTFFVAGFLFLGRLVELWVLMIFSPFAFMSWSMPELFKDVEYINWKAWSEKLIATSFMAPIFMFFLYLIFQLMNSGIFDSLTKKNGGPIATILGVLIPAAMIMMLLRKAVKLAEKGGGALGDKFSKGIEMLGGLATTAAIGAASGGAALALRAGVTAGTGKLATMAAKPESRLGNFSGQLKDFDSFARKRSFDMRAAPEGMKSLMSKGNIFAVQEGGLEGIKERQIEKRKKRADELEKTGTKGHKEEVEKAEIGLKQGMLKNVDIGGVQLPVKLHIENAEKALKEAREDMANAAPEQKGGAALKVEVAKAALKKIKSDTGIKTAEEAVRMAKSNLEVKAGQVRENFATELENMSKGMKVFHTIRKLGAYSASAEKTAARKIRNGENYSGDKKKEEKIHHDKPKDIPSTSKPASGAESGADHGGGGGHAPTGH